MAEHIFYTCTKCLELKSVEEFPPDKRKPKGVQSVCRTCRRLDEQRRRVLRKLNGNCPTKQEKYCPYCKTTQKASDFYLNALMADGLAPYCKTCTRQLAVEQGRNGGYTRHRKHLKGSEAEKRYWASDKGKLNRKKSNARRRAAMKATVHTLTVEEWNEVLAMQDYRCNHCHRDFSESVPPTLDHITPVTLGGDTTKENTQALCQECNSRKGNRWIG